MSRSGIVSVRMVITEEKILSNVEKVLKMINPKSKKQIVQLEEDSYFKDLVESIKNYLIEYPNKNNFPSSVYKAVYELVDFSASRFEENTKTIEDLIRQRENNILLGQELEQLLTDVETKDKKWKDKVSAAEKTWSSDIIEALGIIGRARVKKSEDYQNAVKLIKARIANLQSNLHIEIDMERIEDRSKALSYMGLELVDALKEIPVPKEDVKNVEKVEEVVEIGDTTEIVEEYQPETIQVKPSLWQRIKNSKLVRTIKYIMSIKVVLDLPPALPEGKT